MCKLSGMVMSVPGSPYGVALTECIEHQFQFPIGSPPIAVDGLCPIGRIEKATEEALERIKAASAG